MDILNNKEIYTIVPTIIDQLALYDDFKCEGFFLQHTHL